MYLKSIELAGFKSFAKKEVLGFTSSISGIVGPNGSGKSNIAESFRFVLGEQSMKSMRGKRGEDLIFNGSPSAARSNRASVKVTFDNKDRFLDVDFEEVSIERSVHRDGVNQYAINGSNVRLKDVVELLARANIGATGHHIISQGEADRILNASTKERREIIEDALGLKVFQYKKQESERKLAKTEDNIAQVQSLRKEIMPHLKFLERQVKKVEKALSMRDDLKVLYGEYLKREQEYINHHSSKVKSEKAPLLSSKTKLQEELESAKKILEGSNEGDKKSSEIVELETSIREIRSQKDVLARDVGRVEGQISFEDRRIRREKERAEESHDKLIKLSDVESLKDHIDKTVDSAGHDTDTLRQALSTIKSAISDFIHGQKQSKDEASGLSDRELQALKDEKGKLDEDFKAVIQKETELNNKYELLRKEIDADKDESREAEREVFRIMQEQSKIEAKLAGATAFEDKIKREDEELKRELTEAGVLMGGEVAKYESIQIHDDSGAVMSTEDILREPREKQETRRREIEKIKIRLEDIGGGSAEEIMDEYKEVKGRDEFFEKELTDLAASSESLKGLIHELDEKLDIKFKEGIKKINVAFQEFFALLFDGGAAKLALVREEKRKKKSDLDLEMSDEETPEEVEEAGYEGIEVGVNLPRKKIRGLDMLSGGERALTSIALLFAMSQVNPPPFIILDETDAALDEANSRKYGDMIVNLSKRSQLILITHNRETMARAGILYGVTMGGDGISKILSVQLEEAVMVAK